MQATAVRFVTYISLLFSFIFNPAFAITTYHIGNSLSWDAINGHALTDMFAKADVTLVNNHHIRCGSSLSGTLDNTGDACVSSADGAWDVALANNSYDFLVLQPHEGSSTEEEIAAIKSFATMTNAQIVLYEAYPGFSDAEDISGFYHLPDQNDFRQTQSEFLQIRSAFPNSSVIPAMEVLLELDSLARDGDIPGMATAQDFYRESRHFNEFGKYALGLTHFSALTGLDPNLTTLDLHENYEGVTEQQAIMAQNAVRSVVIGTSSVPIPAHSGYFAQPYSYYLVFFQVNLVAFHMQIN